MKAHKFPIYKNINVISWIATKGDEARNSLLRNLFFLRNIRTGKVFGDVDFRTSIIKYWLNQIQN